MGSTGLVVGGDMVIFRSLKWMAFIRRVNKLKYNGYLGKGVFLLRSQLTYFKLCFYYPWCIKPNVSK